MKKTNYTFKEKAKIYEILSESIERLEKDMEYYNGEYEENGNDYWKEKRSYYKLVIDLIQGLEI